MATAQLRVFPYDDHLDEPEDVSQPTVSVRLTEFLPVLDRAYRERRVWLRDFGDDEVRVSNDLYEILQAFAKV